MSVRNPSVRASGPPLAVLKFGSSILRSAADAPRAVHEIYRHLRAGRRVVAVVSALGDATDRMVAEVRGLEADACSRHVPALLATGEEASVALVCLALERAGVPAARFDARSLGLRCEGSFLDAWPSSLDAAPLLRALEEHPVVVVPGFAGLHADGDLALLGRGGSDLTALFVADVLGAERCVLVKDVDGVYEHDPSRPGPAPRRFGELRHDDALELDGGVVQPKAVRLARELGRAFDVAAPGRVEATRVGAARTRVAEAPPAAEPLRVALLGLGTVGGGVYAALQRDPERFRVTCVLVRDLERARAQGVPDELLVNRLDDVFGAPFDVLVELVGGTGLAGEAVRRALIGGCDVVSANKALLAEDGAELERLAAETGARLAYSAAVGGALPALERVRELARSGAVVELEGVLNGTTNFVLDELAGGADYGAAVARAQELGFAEADPTLDLDGTDAAQKLVLLARAAFGEQEPAWLGVEGIDGLAADAVRAAGESGRVVRLVASCSLSSNGPVACVRPAFVSRLHPLARPRGEENLVQIRTADGALHRIAGKGAGRWPTAEAVLGDLFELERGRAGWRRDGEEVPA